MEFDFGLRMGALYSGASSESIRHTFAAKSIAPASTIVSVSNDGAVPEADGENKPVISGRILY